MIGKRDEHADALRLEEIEHRFGLEALADVDGGTGSDCRRAERIERRRVEERQHGQNLIAARQARLQCHGECRDINCRWLLATPLGADVVPLV